MTRWPIYRAGWSGPMWRDAWYGRWWVWIGPYVFGWRPDYDK